MFDFIREHVYDRHRPMMKDFLLERMIVFPMLWGEFLLPSGVNLEWRFVRFGLEPAQYPSDDVFNNRAGIYSFVVQPGIAKHPACSYMMYIGKTERPFRTRYREYIRDHNKTVAADTERPHVTVMLQKWSKHLLFYYARVDGAELIQTVEDRLIQAYLPPANKDIPGEVGTAVRIILGN